MRQEGSIAVETAVVAPVLLVLMLLVVYAGRAAQADADVQSAVARAARAASLEDSVQRAEETATTAATRNLDTAGVACRQLRIEVDTTRLAPGGTVTVDVACELANTTIAGLAVPGTRWSIATATEVVDTHRGGG